MLELPFSPTIVSAAPSTTCLLLPSSPGHNPLGVTVWVSVPVSVHHLELDTGSGRACFPDGAHGGVVTPLCGTSHLLECRWDSTGVFRSHITLPVSVNLVPLVFCILPTLYLGKAVTLSICPCKPQLTRAQVCPIGSSLPLSSVLSAFNQHELCVSDQPLSETKTFVWEREQNKNCK